ASIPLQDPPNSSKPRRLAIWTNIRWESSSGLPRRKKAKRRETEPKAVRRIALRCAVGRAILHLPGIGHDLLETGVGIRDRHRYALRIARELEDQVPAYLLLALLQLLLVVCAHRLLEKRAGGRLPIALVAIQGSE